jgi:superfamily II DNA or RNA helicase/HKD family nuclease
MSNNNNSAESTPLSYGLYEQVIDRGMRRRLAQIDNQAAGIEEEKLDPGDGDAALTEHLRGMIRIALQALVGDDRIVRQAAVCNRLIEVLSEPAQAEDRRLPQDVQRLLAIWPREFDRAKPERPDTPLAVGCLLAGTRLDPSLISQVRKEFASADRVDILCSFIKWSGIRILEGDLRAFTARPSVRLRIITTSYLGATDFKAVEFLRSLRNTEVRISYDTHRTRLHAKAYLFHRETGFGTAYIGSANLSRPALTEGLEWTVKLSRYESPHLWERVAATFETYWEDGEFVAYDESEQPRLRAALEQERHGGDRPEAEVFLFELRPYAFQQEILDRLEAERTLQGRERHLVVAATGTGKTLIAAFDYRNWCRQVAPASGPLARPRLLFVAHREELLRQSLTAFRHVLRDPNFGDLLIGGQEPEQFDHLFISIQSYNSRSLHEWPADRFDYVVVDEFHHAAAPSYERLLRSIRPRVLLGLTATPERSDGLDILGHFGGHLSARIRLPDAINRKLLSPFQYFAVSDTESLKDLQWQRGGYRLDELDGLFTGNDRRAALIIEKVCEIVLDPMRSRALGFCVSVAHAVYMAEKFRQYGIPADSVSGETPDAVRRGMQDRLRRREINFLFVADLYNEGVDIPEVDTVLFLRPTESLTIFLQQLGRGLRLHDEKECLTVLDFVGQAHRNFRFDLRYRALLTDPTISIGEQVEHGFTHLPAGCTILMEKLARQHVLENITQSLRQTRQALVEDVRALAGALNRLPTLDEFLEYRQIEPDDIYRRDNSFARLLVNAGLTEPFDEPDEARLTKGLRRVAHVSDADQIGSLLTWFDPERSPRPLPSFDPIDERRQLMADLSIWGKDSLPGSPEESLRRLDANPMLRGELLELLRYRIGCIDTVAPRLELAFPCPLALHASYTRDEVLAGLGHWTRSRRRDLREGVLHLPEIGADVFFFTLNKTEKHYSPTTMYQDYAINERRFHWQSQSTTSADSPTGRRYIEHESRGHTILLFGRENKGKGLAEPYVFLGPARYVGHTGSRPMSITWELRHPLPARLFRMLARLSVA